MRLTRPMGLPTHKEEELLLWYQKRTVLCWIYRTGGQLHFLTLTTRLATKAIANRLEASLPKLINHDQTGLIKGRYIGENMRFIINAMEYTKAHNIPGILVYLDFRKAFDSLEWHSTPSILERVLKKWVSTFYTNIESAALNNGFLTKCFRPSRGVRQGCPLSPYLFILSVEIMANKRQQEPSIEGIKILGNKQKLGQYVDNTNICCPVRKRLAWQ